MRRRGRFTSSRLWPGERGQEGEFRIAIDARWQGRRGIPMTRIIVMIFASAALMLAADQTFTGTITDDMCGGSHKDMNMGPDEKCVIECVRGGAKYALWARSAGPGGSRPRRTSARSTGTTRRRLRPRSLMNACSMRTESADPPPFRGVGGSPVLGFRGSDPARALSASVLTTL